MDDPAIFQQFLMNNGRLTVPRAQQELLGFINTFETLLTTTDEEIDSFMSTSHASNNAHSTNNKIIKPIGKILSSKAVLFELKDRERCDALPGLQILQSLNAEEVTIMRAQSTKALEVKNKYFSLPDMVVPKLTPKKL